MQDTSGRAIFAEKETETTMEIKAHDTFWQRRKLRGHGLQPILMEVLEVEEVIGTRNICKVRWHILGKDSVSTSVFPMMAITERHFADFVPIPRELFLKAMDIRKILRLKNFRHSKPSTPAANTPSRRKTSTSTKNAIDIC